MAAASFGRRFQRSFLLGRQYSDRSPPTLKRAPRFQVDTNSALSGKTRREVFRGWMVYKLLSYNWIVQSSMEVRARVSLHESTSGELIYVYM